MAGSRADPSGKPVRVPLCWRQSLRAAVGVDGAMPSAMLPTSRFPVNPLVTLMTELLMARAVYRYQYSKRRGKSSGSSIWFCRFHDTFGIMFGIRGACDVPSGARDDHTRASRQITLRVSHGLQLWIRGEAVIEFCVCDRHTRRSRANERRAARATRLTCGRR